MREVFRRWKTLLKDRSYVSWLIFGALFVILGNLLIVTGATYRDEVGNITTVGDLLLNWIPATDLMSLYVWGPIVILIVFALYLFVYKPQLFPYALFAFGLIAFARAFFIQLTHLGPPNDIIYLKKSELIKSGFDYLYFKSDLFFSGHVANSFMPFLIVKNKPFLKWGLFVGSLLMGATVLVMHVHYSIDVFAAFFITYSLYVIAGKVFKGLNKCFEKVESR